MTKWRNFFLSSTKLSSVEKLKSPPKFTLGTSDESDEDDEENDLERLFCPLTDSNGSPAVVI